MILTLNDAEDSPSSSEEEVAMIELKEFVL
jgi:hypothetical protein